MNRAKNRKALAAFALMVLLAACANPDTAATQAPPPETASAGSTAPDVAESERFPTSENYPPGTMERWSFDGGAPAHWRLSALRTPGREAAPWRIVVITGTPSWSEYWAPAIAKAPANREMIVADRPGFSRSEPESAVTDIAAQARALSPLLNGPPDQKVLLVGQSFGSPIATLMAAERPDRVKALVLVSSYFGDRGPTAARLVAVGSVIRPILPRDMRNAILEVRAQGPQLPRVWTALRGLQMPIVFIHADRDSFVPVESARRIATEYGHTLVEVPGGDHFLNACCVDSVLAAMEQAIGEAEGRESAVPPRTESSYSAP